MLARRPTPAETNPSDEMADAEALAEYEAKGGISHAAVITWVRSWGTEDELPPPQIGD